MIHRLLLALTFSALALSSAAAQSDVPFSTGPLTIVKADGTQHAFKVELAETSEQRARGLMFRDVLGPDRGMLFDYKSSRRVSMWMKNTLIPLDMLFIRADGTVESIRERAVPHSLDPIASRGRVLAVLELAGGSVDRLGLAPGDTVLHPIFER